MRCILLLFLVLTTSKLSAQKITFSDIINEDTRDIRFDILGKVGNNFVVYKNVRWKHMITVYDQNMKLVNNDRMEFIPDKTFNIDFIVYPDFYYMIYQYQKKNTIWCKAIKMSSTGKKLAEPVVLDTSRIGLVADRKIYNTVHSDDRSKILVYKMQRKNDKLTITTKLYDPELNLLDSSRQLLPFEMKHDVYSDLFVDNKGSYLFAKEYKQGWRDNISQLNIIVRDPGKEPVSFDVPLKGKYVDEIKIRIDNLNENYVINSLYSDKRDGSLDGLFTAVLKKKPETVILSAINRFEDSIRAKINAGGQYSTAFDNLFLRQTFLKKNGGFVITAEDYYTQANNSTNYPRRWDNIYNSPNTSNYDYYQNNSSYYRYYRPYGDLAYMRSLRYYYDDIVVMSIDSTLKMEWSTLIHKKQADDEHDNFLSYANMNAGAEIHFLFSDSKKSQIINNHSILPAGQLKRYATLKSHETGYEFMPKLAKQVGARTVLVPCIYRGSIAFARIDFIE